MRVGVRVIQHPLLSEDYMPRRRQVNGGLNTYSLAVPADPGIALPGYWYLFAVNAAGVPSVSWTMLVALP